MENPSHYIRFLRNISNFKLISDCVYAEGLMEGFQGYVPGLVIVRIMVFGVKIVCICMAILDHVNELKNTHFL